ncbi:thiol-disulfide oxidoreductase ResA [Pseudalkalibacillus caeni]|uniref:Thiol-disulfide oxidoreductase ResA n=1 Tax=Exobacillus caeni TaxID=2574798 RepID=A0A5R9EXP6_9BACL|nr:thiol-disulfide oxidoreductase ResA [Pseudalkalibacillus caeni]TLS35631.1 thiol-disulfide oxidoreductase ResA [Pseudalkalibacillus caeni]
MKKNRLVIRTVILAVVVIAVGYTFYANFFASDSGVIEEGDTAPNFILTDLKGNEVELEDYRGQGVFLNFWATYCEPCKEEMPAMDKVYQKYKDQGIEILAVNVTEPRLTAKTFVDRYNLSFPILLDKGNDVTNHYGVGLIPATFLINKDGEVVKKIVEGSLSEEKIENYMELIKP